MAAIGNRVHFSDYDTEIGQVEEPAGRIDGHEEIEAKGRLSIHTQYNKPCKFAGDSVSTSEVLEGLVRGADSCKTQFQKAEKLRQIYQMFVEITDSVALELPAGMNDALLTVFMSLPKDFREDVYFQVWKKMGSPETYGADFGGEFFKETPFHKHCIAAFFAAYKRPRAWFGTWDKPVDRLHAISHLERQVFQRVQRYTHSTLGSEEKEEVVDLLPLAYRNLCYFYQLFHLDGLRSITMEDLDGYSEFPEGEGVAERISQVQEEAYERLPEPIKAQIDEKLSRLPPIEGATGKKKIHHESFIRALRDVYSTTTRT